MAAPREELLKLAERLQIPVAASASGLGAIDCNHPLALGLVARAGHYQANHATRQADVLLALGVRFDDRTSSSWIPGYSFTIPPTRLIHVDIDPEEIGRNYPVALGLMADVRMFLQQIHAELDRRADLDQAAPMRAKNGWRRSIPIARNGTSSSRPDFPTTPRRSTRSAPRSRSTRRCRRMRSSSATSACTTTGCSSFCKPKRPDSLIGSMGFGPMGFGVAGVMGAKFAAPDRPCVSVCGDGAFFMHANVLGTAVEYNLPVVWVVWNNYAYASIRGLQRGYLGGRELATDFHDPVTGQRYNPDFAAMARSCGVEGVRVDRAGDLGEAIRKGIARQQALSDRRRHRRRHQSGRRRRLGAARPRPQQAGHRHAVRADLILARHRREITLRKHACSLQARRSSWSAVRQALALRPQNWPSGKAPMSSLLAQRRTPRCDRRKAQRDRDPCRRHQ